MLVLQHAEAEGPGLFAAPLEEAGLPLRVVRTFLGEPVPETADSLAGLLLMGGPMGVYEASRHPHLGREIDLVRQALTRSVPVLGVCLGAQILAAAAGAGVHPGRRKEIGWFPIRLAGEGRSDPVLGALPEEATVFHWHGDTFDLPAGATLLASSTLYRNQAFRIGPRAYGLQFHVEVTPEMVDRFLEAGADEAAAVLGPDGPARLRSEARVFVPALGPCVPRLVRGFLRQAGIGAQEPVRTTRTGS